MHDVTMLRNSGVIPVLQAHFELSPTQKEGTTETYFSLYGDNGMLFAACDSTAMLLFLNWYNTGIATLEL